MDLWIDEHFTRRPGASRTSSAVFLRNQNESPTANFTARPFGSREVVLNGSSSVDPEGRTLRFMWFKAPAPAFTCDEGPPAALLLWQGVTMNHVFPASDGASGATSSIELVVCDPGNLQSRISKPVTIP
jgi:hypothetical protein